MLEVCTATMQLPPSKQQFTSSGEEWEEEENGRRLNSRLCARHYIPQVFLRGARDNVVGSTR
jgi:hypothetical protein